MDHSTEYNSPTRSQIVPPKQTNKQTKNKQRLFRRKIFLRNPVAFQTALFHISRRSWPPP